MQMVQTIYVEHLGDVELYLGLGIEIVTGLILGGLVGYEREQKMKNAGIKTNILICIGATLYTAISVVVHHQYGKLVDPTRIAAQIVTGVGFIGAGVIMHHKGNIVGLTTAATVWVVAAIGVTIGFGYPVIATIFTFTCLIILKILGPIYQGLESTKNHKYFHVEITASGDIKNIVKELVFNTTDRIDALHEEIFDKKLNKRRLDFYIFTHPKKMRQLNDELRDIVQVENVHFHITENKKPEADDEADRIEDD